MYTLFKNLVNLLDKGANVTVQFGVEPKYTFNTVWKKKSKHYEVKLVCQKTHINKCFHDNKTNPKKDFDQ